MKISEALTLIRTIQILELMGEFVTRHQIAKNIKSMSRSTVYRKVDYLRLIGMVNYQLVNGNIRVMVSRMGESLAESQEELGL